MGVMSDPAAPVTIFWCEIPSAVGSLLLAGTQTHLKYVHFQCGPRPLGPHPDWQAAAEPFARAAAQLAEYFDGTRRRFELDVDPAGTAFQLRVWRALACVPYGSVVSYGELARRIGQPQACRAVGLANGANPLPIIIPCHRVIGADGALTGFGGGLDIKRRLLAHERRLLGEELQLTLAPSPAG
jgi:methylated-DNA-[protein]-cysteine S-methyltransferase